MEKARDQLEKDIGSVHWKALDSKILELAIETNVAEEEFDVLWMYCMDLTKSSALDIAWISNKLIMMKPDVVAVEQTNQEEPIY